MKLSQNLKKGIEYLVAFALLVVLVWKNTHPNGPFSYLPYVILPSVFVMVALRVYDIVVWWKTAPLGTKLKDRNFNCRPVWYLVLMLAVAVGVIIWAITGVNPLAIPNL